MTRIYVASPYSHPDPAVVDARVDQTERYVAHLWRERGQHPFSPICHWHRVCRSHALPGHAAAWAQYNRRELALSEVLHVLAIDGWRESVGVAMEIRWARGMGMFAAMAVPTVRGYELRRLEGVS